MFSPCGHFSTQRPAAHAGIHSVIVRRIVDQLVHEALTESLHLGCTVVAVSHQRKIGVHAGIPAAVSLYPVACIKIFDIIALTGRAGERTGSAGQTGV